MDSGIHAPILFWDKNKVKNTGVLYFEARKEFDNGKNENKLRDHDIVKIYNTYHNWETIDKYSYVASFEEIQENDFNLNIPRYVDTFEEEEPVDIKFTQQEISRIKNELSEVEKKMDKYLIELGY